VRVREHNLLADLEAGQKVVVVHHIDGDKTNNNLSNLWGCLNQSEHVRVHKTYDDLLPALLQLGIVTFEPESGGYVLRGKSHVECPIHVAGRQVQDDPRPDEVHPTNLWHLR
jgi:hypothetical protein